MSASENAPQAIHNGKMQENPPTHTFFPCVPIPGKFPLGTDVIVIQNLLDSVMDPGNAHAKEK